MGQYVIDTSVLLSYGSKIFKAFPESEIIIPLVVVQELEAKRHDPELGLMARSVLRHLDKLSEEGDLSQGVEQEDDSTVSVHLNDVYCADLPETIKDIKSNDIKILSVAKNIGATLLTNDIPLRVQASVVGIDTENFIDQDFKMSPDVEPFIDIHMSTEDITDLYTDGDLPVDSDFPINTNLIVHDLSDDKHTALAISKAGWNLKLANEYALQPSKSKTVRARNAMQKFYLDHLMNENVKIVSCGGVPGGGKSLLALAAGESLVQAKEFEKVVVFKGAYTVLGGDLGFLPGTETEKFSGYTASVFDATSVYSSKQETERRIEQGKLEILPLTHLRGRTLNNSYIIVDEAQNLELSTLLTVLTRLGKGSKIVLTHDIRQRDNLSVGKHQGIFEVIKRLSGNKLFAHVEMVKSERSDVANLAYELLSDLTN